MEARSAQEEIRLVLETLLDQCKRKKKHLKNPLLHTPEIQFITEWFFYVVSQFVVGCLKSVLLFVSLQYYLP